MEKKIRTMVESIEEFRKKGYTEDFIVEDEFLKCKTTGESFRSEDVKIDHTERYEGESNPDDMSIVYAISANTGTKGILIDAYGVYADMSVSEFIKSVPLDRIDKSQTKIL